MNKHTEGDTPIERRFHAALMNEIDNCPPIVIEPQSIVCDHRVDFLIIYKSKALIVECDGHEFHERTKEQAARDRSRDREYQQAGCSVFRFTGSEIFRDSKECARQVIDWVKSISFEEDRCR